MVATHKIGRRRWTWPAMILIGGAVSLALLLVGALIIHSILLSTASFNWLEPARH